MSRYASEDPDARPVDAQGDIGSNLALANVFLACATSLAVLNIAKANDDAGTPILPAVSYTSGMVRYAFKPYMAVRAWLIMAFTL